MIKTRTILAYGNEELRTKCEDADWRERKDIEDLLTAYHSLPKCLGLAANQIGITKRIITAFGSIYINPEIIKVSDETQKELEGCMSFPQVFGKIVRPKKIVLRWVNIYGREQKAKFKNLMARVIMHEIDSINGISFIDHFSKEEWKKVQKDVTKIMLGDGEWAYDMLFEPKLKEIKNFEATRMKPHQAKGLAESIAKGDGSIYVPTGIGKGGKS